MLKIFKDMKLGMKIGGGFTILLIIAAVMAFLGYNGLNSVDHDVMIANDAAGFAESALEIRQNEKDFMLREEEQFIDNINAMVDNMLVQGEETKTLMNDQE